MKSRHVLLGTSTIAVICSHAFARCLHAQERWLEPLATPPLTAGTCVPPIPSRIGSTSETTTRYRLVMVSVSPGRRREMTVSLDASARPRTYTEMSSAQTGALTSTAQNIFATIDMHGRARGTLSRMLIKRTDALPAHGDTAAFRKYLAAKKHSVADNTSEPLDLATQRRVVELAKWLATRCK